MTRPLLVGLLLLSLASCFDKVQPEHVKETNQKFLATTVGPQMGTYTDNSVTLFGDSSYKLTLHTFDTANNFDAERYNAVLTFAKQEKSKIHIYFIDSIFCMHPTIEFQDFNNDKVKDVMIFCYTGARANPTYHLYLTDLKNRRLTRVKGFESLPNPSLDTSNNIITSVALSGTNYYRFYRISSNNTLINLYQFEEDPEDTTQYEKAIRQIRKIHK